MHKLTCCLTNLCRNSQRSTFIIGKDQIIHKTWYNVKASGHASKVLNAIEALKEMSKVTDV